MKKITINGIEFNNFGSNNYSCEMELITVTNPPKGLVGRVLAGAEPGFENIWLNPSAPCNEFEFFGVLGTHEQYKKFYQSQKEAQIGKAMVNKFGFGCWPDEAFTYEKELRKNYKDWWEK